MIITKIFEIPSIPGIGQRTQIQNSQCITAKALRIKLVPIKPPSPVTRIFFFSLIYAPFY